MKQLLHNENDYIVLSCEKKGLRCGFILKLGFTVGVISSNHYHFHSSYEIHVPVNGNIHIMVEDRDLLVRPGEVCVIPPGVIHYIFEAEDTYRIGFRFTFVQSTKADDEGYQLFRRTYGRLTDACTIKECRLYEKYFAAGVQNMTEELPAFMTGELLFLALYEAALRLDMPGERKDVAVAESAEDRDTQLSELIETWLNNHYGEQLVLGDLAAYLNFSTRQTERIIDRLFGMPFTALVNRKRLVMAKLLLKITEQSVEEVASQVGFRDRNYFYRKFSEYFGMTPGNYRSQKAADG